MLTTRKNGIISFITYNYDQRRTLGEIYRHSKMIKHIIVLKRFVKYLKKRLDSIYEAEYLEEYERRYEDYKEECRLSRW